MQSAFLISAWRLILQLLEDPGLSHLGHFLKVFSLPKSELTKEEREKKREFVETTLLATLKKSLVE